MRTHRPIEIIGGGLAGLALGCALRRAGIDVALFEAGNYPRHRVCGEFIAGLPDTTRSRLRLNALLRDAAIDHEVAWFSGPTLSRIQKLPLPAIGISRHALDLRLATEFESLGGVLRINARMPNLPDAPGRIFATGRRRGRPQWLGLKIHSQALALHSDLEVHLGDHAYVGLARIENGLVNICGLFQRRSICAKGPDLLLGYLQAAGLSELAARLAHSPLDSDSFSAVAAVDFDPRVPLTREVRLGDACAVIPPFTGNGMAMAFQSAEIALDPLVAYARGNAEWPETRRTIQTALRRQFRVRLASAHTLHAFLLRPGRQRWLALLNRVRLLPLRPLYAALH